MGTGVVSALLHLFPYNNGCLALKVMGLIFFLLNLTLFTFVCTCTVLRYWWFPEVRFMHRPFTRRCPNIIPGLVLDARASRTKFVHRLLPYGSSDLDQLWSSKPSHLLIFYSLV